MLTNLWTQTISRYLALSLSVSTRISSINYNSGKMMVVLQWIGFCVFKLLSMSGFLFNMSLWRYSGIKFNTHFIYNTLQPVSLFSLTNKVCKNSIRLTQFWQLIPLKFVSLSLSLSLFFYFSLARFSVYMKWHLDILQFSFSIISIKWKCKRIAMYIVQYKLYSYMTASSTLL